MKSMYRNALVALVASLAVVGVSASTALAAPEWYAKSGGVFTKVTSPKNVATTVNLELTAKLEVITGESATFKCVNPAGVHGAATVGAGSAGEISAMNTSFCTTTSPWCKTVQTEWGGFAWGTGLYLEGSQIRQQISKKTATNPQLSIGGCGDMILVCQIITSTHMTNNAAGNVEAVFDATSKKTQCSSGLEAGTWKGVITYLHPSGTEAIKVQ